MALIFTDDQNYSDIADAIRAKNGSSDTYLPSEMADAIAAISGSGSGGTDFIVTVTKNSSTGLWEPTCSFADIQSAYNAGKNIVVATDYFEAAANGNYDDSDDVLYYFVTWPDYDTDCYKISYYIFDSNGVTDDGDSQFIPLPSGSLSITSNDTYDVTNYAQAVVNVSSGGGGGSSNIAKGVFEGTTANSVLSVNTNYSGNGYPLAVVIYPSEGLSNNGGDFYAKKQRYAITCYVAVKGYPDLAPTYGNPSSASANNYTTIARYKSSSTTASTQSQSATTSQPFCVQNDPSGSDPMNAVKMKSKTEMLIFVAGTSYGFSDNVEYTYLIIYSS